MQSEANSKKEQLGQRIRESLREAEAYSLRARKTYTWLVIGGLIGSAVTVLVAGGTAVQGPVGVTGIAGWRLACIIAAILSLISTICVGLVQQLKLGERLPKGQLCTAQLRALDLSLEIQGREPDEVLKEYEDILKAFPDVI